MTHPLLWTAPCDNGLLEGELCLPDNPLAMLILPHPLYFRTDTTLQRRLKTLQRLGFATLCCNVHHLGDIHAPPLLNDVSRTSERLLAILTAWQFDSAKPDCPTFFYAHDVLAHAAARAMATRDLIADRLICNHGNPFLAGRNYLAHLNTPTLWLTPSDNKDLLHPHIAQQPAKTASPIWFDDACISWTAQEVKNVRRPSGIPTREKEDAARAV